jgi:hypothetical protein
MKTALQEVFSDLEKLHPNLFNVYTTEGKQFINHFHKYLKMEKKQLCYFYIKGAKAELNNPYVTNIEFYNKTFKNAEQ